MNEFTTLLASIAMVWGGGTASAEILAMMNYESKTPDQVVDFNTMGAGVLLEMYCRIPSAGGQGRKL